MEYVENVIEVTLLLMIYLFGKVNVHLILNVHHVSISIKSLTVA